MNAKVTTAVVLVAILVAGCGGSSIYTQASGSGTKWDGFGATLASFRAAHPGPGCPSGDTIGGAKACAGPVVKGGAPIPSESGTAITPTQFWDIQSTSDGIYELDEAFSPHTTIKQAESDVLKLLPLDTTAMSLTTVNVGGGTCAYWNLQSSTLGNLMGRADSAGQVGVEFNAGNNDFISNYVTHAVYPYRLATGHAGIPAPCGD